MAWGDVDRDGHMDLYVGNMFSAAGGRITFLPQFVSPTDPDAAGKMIFLGLYFIALAAFIATLVILLVDWLADMLKSNRRIMRTIDWLFAGVFSAFAVRLLFVEGK